MTVISKLHWPVSLCHSYREQTCSVFWHHCTQRFLKGEKASTHHRDNNEQHNHFHWVSFSNFSRRQRGRKYRTDGIYSHTRDVCTGHKKLYFYWETPEMASVAVALVQGSTLSVTTHHPLSQQSTHSSFPAPGSLFIALILEQPVFQCRPVGLLPETFIPLTSHKKVPRSLQEVQMTNFSSADVTSQLNWSLGCWWDETNIAVSGCLWVWGLMWSVVWQKPMRTFHEALITELSVATLSKTGTLKDDIHAIHFSGRVLSVKVSVLFSISACSHQHSNVSVITVQWEQSRSSTVFTVCLLLISGAELPLGLRLHVWLQERTKTPPAVCWVKVFPDQTKTWNPKQNITSVQDQGQEHILSSLTHHWQSYHDLPEAPCHKHRREYNLDQFRSEQYYPSVTVIQWWLWSSGHVLFLMIMFWRLHSSIRSFYSSVSYNK